MLMAGDEWDHKSYTRTLFKLGEAAVAPEGK
jgi:hypothetical protein